MGATFVRRATEELTVASSTGSATNIQGRYHTLCRPPGSGQKKLQFGTRRCGKLNVYVNGLEPRGSLNRDTPKHEKDKTTHLYRMHAVVR